MRKEKTKKKITGLDDEQSKNTANFKNKLNIEKHETIGGLDLPEGRELKEEVIENSKKITTQKQWYRRRAEKLSAAAAARRSTKVGGGAHKLSVAAARRGRRTALLRGPNTYDEIEKCFTTETCIQAIPEVNSMHISHCRISALMFLSAS